MQYFILKDFQDTYTLLQSMQDIFHKDKSTNIELSYISDELNKQNRMVINDYQNYLTYLLGSDFLPNELIDFEEGFLIKFIPEYEYPLNLKLNKLREFKIDKENIILNESWVYELKEKESIPNNLTFSMDNKFIESLLYLIKDKGSQINIYIINNNKMSNKNYFKDNESMFDNWLVSNYKRYNATFDEFNTTLVSTDLFSSDDISVLNDIIENNDSYLKHPAIGRFGIEKELLAISEKINEKIKNKTTQILIKINEKYYLL